MSDPPNQDFWTDPISGLPSAPAEFPRCGQEERMKGSCKDRMPVFGQPGALRCGRETYPLMQLAYSEVTSEV